METTVHTLMMQGYIRQGSPSRGTVNLVANEEDV